MTSYQEIMDGDQTEESSDFPVHANHDQSLVALNGEDEKSGKHK